MFHKEPTDTVLIAVTGIHGNFFSNPFYYNIGDYSRIFMAHSCGITEYCCKSELIGFYFNNYFDGSRITRNAR